MVYGNFFIITRVRSYSKYLKIHNLTKYSKTFREFLDSLMQLFLTLIIKWFMVNFSLQQELDLISSNLKFKI